MDKYKIGIDLGGTKIETILLDHKDKVQHRKRIKTPKQEGYMAILNSLAQLITDTLHFVPKGKQCSIGIGIPGTINNHTHLVQNANTTCLIGKPFKKDLEKKLGRETFMENDANCFVLAESKSGAATGYGFVFGIIMGTGCGGGICINGSIRQGNHGIAGEWGHISIDPEGTRCYCGNKGCIETKISGSGVESSFYKKFNKSLKMHEIVQGFREGEPDCVYAFNSFLEEYGRSIGGLISLLDPDAIVLGGGLSKIDELYSQGLEFIRKYAFHNKVETPILKNKMGDSAGVFGAAWLEQTNSM